MIRRRFLYLFMAVFIVNCSQRVQQFKSSQEDQRTKEVIHSNGLKVRLAESLNVEELPDGFKIMPQGSESRRYPVQVLVRLYSGQQKPEGEWPKERQIGSRIIKYRESKSEAGGASGDQLILTLEAWESNPAGHIFYIYTSPDSEQDVSLGWRIIENTVIAKSN
jgi:hypothetical protein